MAIPNVNTLLQVITTNALISAYVSVVWEANAFK